MILSIFLVGCVNEDVMIENCNLKLQILNDSIIECEVCDNCTICSACSVCETCSVNDETYLSFKEYQDMSIRIKWLEKRLLEVNGTDHIYNLEDNLTICISAFNICNSTLSNITELIKP